MLMYSGRECYCDVSLSYNIHTGQAEKYSTLITSLPAFV
jgi:hypothetical protein